MSNQRRLIDHVFKLAAPTIHTALMPEPTFLADGVWSLLRYLRMPGGPLLPSRTTIVRLESGGLALISPPPAHPQTFAAIDALGTVEALIAPNSFHHLYVNDAQQRYPAAKLYLAPGLQDRIATLPAGIDLAAATVSPDLQQIVLDCGRRLSEVFLFHRPSRFLILSDAAFNMIHLERRFDRIFWRAFGVPGQFGPSRTARLMLLTDRRIAGAALRRVLEWPFEKIIVAHGDVVEADARASFERGFARYLEA